MFLSQPGSEMLASYLQQEAEETCVYAGSAVQAWELLGVWSAALAGAGADGGRAGPHCTAWHTRPRLPSTHKAEAHSKRLAADCPHRLTRS